MYASPYPQALQNLVLALRTLPGLGQRSAERLAFHCLEQTPQQAEQLYRIVLSAREKIQTCTSCGCFFDTTKDCWSCSVLEGRRICIVAHPKDAFVIQSTHSFQGCFHVLGGLLNPLKEIHPEQLRLEMLKKKILSTRIIEEILIATDATLEGDATALYLKKMLDDFARKEKLSFFIYRLGFGMPLNSSLEHVDSATLAQAITGKHSW